MKVLTIDSKRRVVLPGAKPGDCYSVHQTTGGHYELAKVITVPKNPKPKPSEIDALLASAALTSRMSSEQLHHLTREL